jgi:superfamily II DNA or RNA helicase
LRHNPFVTLRIRIDNRIHLLCNDIAEEVRTELKQQFEHSNPQFYKTERLGYSTFNIPRVIRTWDKDTRWNDHWLSFPRGGLQRIRDVLDKFDIDRDIEDERVTGPSVEMPDHLKKLYAYQETLKQVALEKQQCILKAPTGSGKTTCALAIAASMITPTIVIVSTRALFDQWITRAQEELGLKKKDIGVIQGSKHNLKPLTIAMQKTLASQGVSKEAKAYFGCVICDEVHLFAAATFIEAVDPFPAKYRLGISADHTRKDKKEFLLYDLFGPVGAEIKRGDLVKSGHILDVDVFVIPSEFKADWYGIPEEKDDDFEDIVGDDDTQAEPEKQLDFDRLLKEMGDDEERNKLVIKAVEYEVEKEQVLVMSWRREHCRLLDQLLVRNGYSTGFLIGGEDYRREFVATRQKFEQEALQVAVGTFQAIGYGIDLPKASNVVCATPIAGNKQFFNQVRGRVCRIAKGKKSARMYYVWDRTVYGAKHLKNLARWNGADRVKVLDPSGKWIDVKTFIKAMRIAA